MSDSPDSIDPSPLRSLGLTKTEYAEALLPLPPLHVADVLRSRMKQAKVVNDEIGEFFRERILIEEAYVRGLQKLSRRPPIAGITSLQSYNTGWEQIRQHIGMVASAHAALARRLTVELENPLKTYSSSSDFGQLPQFEGNLQSLAETHETARLKSEKAKSKGKAKKLEEMVREENDARASWETEAPLILEKLQTIDEARLVLLKDTFVKSMMMDIETSQSSVSDAERVVNSLLSLTPTKEVEAFVAQQKDVPRPSGHERRRSTMSSNQISIPEPTPSTSTRLSPAPTRRTMPATGDDGAIRADKRKSRFGTILRSSRNSIRAPNLYLRASSPDKPKKEANQERVEQDQTQNITPVTSQTSQNGVTLHSEPIAPARSSSIANIEPQMSPIKEDQPAPLSQVAEEAEGGSALPNETPFAPPLRVEIKDNVIPEEAGEREAAVNTLQSTLRAQPTISRKNRGRRDGRSSFAETETNEFGVISPPTQAIRQMSMSPISPMSNARMLSPIRMDSDTQSLSSVGTVSRPSTLALHPDLGTPGFNISILEFLSVMLSHNQVQKIFVTGEVAVSSNEQQASGIRLSDTENIEQIVSNTTYVNDTGGGTYSLTNESLPPKGAIVLKYKTTLIPEPQSQVPLLIRAKWKMESDSLSLMIAYHSNPLFSASRSISNVVITAILPTDIRVQSCQSKPLGQFSNDRRRLVWNLPSADESERVLIAKFAAEGQSKGDGLIEAKWECKGVLVTGIQVNGIGAKNPFADEEDLFFQANILRNLGSIVVLINFGGINFSLKLKYVIYAGICGADKEHLGSASQFPRPADTESMDPVHNFIREIPKCELHLHIEGTLSPELLLRLAAKNRIQLPEIYSSIPALKNRYENFTDLQDFLNIYYQGISVLRDESDYEELTVEYFRQAHSDGVHHAELFFDIQVHTSRSVPHSTVVNGLLKGRQRAKESFGITSDLIVCFVRHEGESSALEEFTALEPYFDSGDIIGIGMDSTEIPCPPENFSRLYAQADRKGLRKCAHAGEEGPSAYIRTVIDNLKVHRVDHGIRAIDDLDLCKDLAERRIPLTVCPLSNVKLQCVPSLVHLPIPRFLELGMQVTVNSDDPAYFGGYLLDNMLALQKAFSWDWQVWETLCLNGIEASFCSDERKSELKRALKEAVAKHIQS